MRRSPTLLARLWRRVYQGGNPLARPSDRVEGFLLAVVVLAVVGLLPWCVSVGTDSFAHRKGLADVQRDARYPATATLLANGPAIAPGGQETVAGAAGPTAATWVLSDGSRRFGEVSADAGTPKGSTIPVWLDQAGNPVAAPESDTAVAVYALSLGAFLWLGLTALLVAAFWLVRHFLDTARYARWQLEWSRVEGRWSHS
jgi:hypothetical protein